MFNVVSFIKEYFTNKLETEEPVDSDGMTVHERNEFIFAEEERIREEEKMAKEERRKLLRIIKTLRTQDEIVRAEAEGLILLKEEVKASKNIRVTDLHIKDKETGEIDITTYSFHSLPRDYERYEVVEKRTYYPYDFPSKVAAYVLPADLGIGEHVILEDLIEDIVGASHPWGTYRLDSAEAVWSGEKFEIDCHSYDVEITMG